MSETDTAAHPAKREYAQLLRTFERLLTQLRTILDETTSPGTVSLLRDIKAATGKAPDVSDVVSALEEAVKAIKLAEAQAQKAVFRKESELEIEGVPNLPPHLRRFLAERAAQPGFSYEVVQDEVRGWMICWKEYTQRGTVRGYGQFYERPYAWLED